MNISLRAAVEATGGTLTGIPAAADQLFEKVATDTRTLVPGALFVALHGPRFDGHDYLAEAVARGATGLLVDRDCSVTEVPVIRVPDTLIALGDLGRWVRRTLGLKVLAITGSVGKTSTKEMAAAVLAAAGVPALVTPGNWNNRVGLPLTLLGARGDEHAAVLELGISEPGEMAHLTRICEPDAALITAVAVAHTEGLGSLHDVAREKLAVSAGLRPGGALVVPADEPLLQEEHAGGRTLTFGWREEAQFRGDELHSLGAAGSQFRVTGTPVRIGLPGRHLADNALAALAGLHAAGLPWRDGVGSLAQLQAPPLRGEVRRTRGGVGLLVDCYNANPRAMEAALQTLSELAAGTPGGTSRRIAVLGEMRELGALSEASHRRVGRAAAEHGIDQLHLLGRDTAWVREAAAEGGVPAERIWIYDDREALAVSLRRQLRPGDWVLLKGSRALGLEVVLEALEQGDGPALALPHQCTDETTLPAANDGEALPR